MKDSGCKKTFSFGHGGNIYDIARKKNGALDILDFSANINPLGPPSWLRRFVSRQLENIIHYPDPYCTDFVQVIAKEYDLSVDTIIPANGTTELLYLIPRVINVKRAVIPVPSYIDYKKVMELNGIELQLYKLNRENLFELNLDDLKTVIRSDDVVLLGSPNNPTASTLDPDKLIRIAKDFQDTWFIVDEAFLDFLGEIPSVAGQAPNIITLNSMTKFYALPGLRVGFGVFPSNIAEKIRHQLPPWTVNSLAQSIGTQVFADTKYREESIKYLEKQRNAFHTHLSKFKELFIFPSRVNYFFIKILQGTSAKNLAEKLLEKNIMIRVCENYEGLDESYFRIAVRTEKENMLFVRALEECFAQKNISSPIKRKPKKSLMIQGTSSNAGKSVLVAALCRILLQDGIRVAPFKAQNMSLNSYVTHKGLEMGRAQVVQAQASRIDPDVRMNPVLLKPNSDMGSQIIVNGKPVGNMSVQQYVKYKDQAWIEACKSYNELASEFDVLVLEGAGSPGEVNLKHHDIVNMHMAKYTESPVLLVGDIDRGGVYASFVGTMEVLEEWERKLIAGFIVNRFRGDASLLKSAHDYVWEHTGRKVLGTIPYIENLGIPEEDSVSFKAGHLQKKPPKDEYVEIALINLPHISNFTDIEPFLDEPDVYLKIVHTVDELGDPDAIIIPGSKNVMGDLAFLQGNSLDQAIKNKADIGVEIVGVCGGYQILGTSVSDPHSIESEKEVRKGLNLLDIETVLAPEKTLICKKGIHRKTGLEVTGYEIHHGLSHGPLQPVIAFDDGSFCGAIHPRLPIWGSYLHGIFDADTFRRWFIDNLREKKGLKPTGKIVAPYNLEIAFDRLAQTVRESLDIDAIYRLINI